MSLSFPRSWGKLDPSSVNLLGSQSGHGGGHEINRCASRLNQGDGGGAGFCDGSIISDDRSRETHTSNQVESAPLKVKLIRGSHGISNLQVMEEFFSEPYKNMYAKCVTSSQSQDEIYLSPN